MSLQEAKMVFKFTKEDEEDANVSDDDSSDDDFVARMQARMCAK